jgi:tetratricopeptide (TPR) repeat protein
MPSVFELVIGPERPATDTFLVRVIRSEAGEASASVVLDLPGLVALRGDVQRAVLTSATASSQARPEGAGTLRSVGSTLFTALLGTATVHACYRSALALADQRGEDLRVVVRLESAELAALPWEAMYDAARGDYVCLREQVVRHLPVPSVPAPLQIQAPLHLLVVTAAPQKLAPLNVIRERDHLQRALDPLVRKGLVTVDWAEQAGWADLQVALMRRPYHCLHFIGHGGFDEETDQGELVLVGADGRPDMVEASRFVSLLRTAQPIPRLVLLNSCSGAAVGVGDLFSGTASALVRGGVSAVVAMQYEITDAASVEFARGFYTGIAHGRGVDAAVAAGRVAILGMNGHTLEWVTPTLHLRGDNPQLFAISRPDATDEARAPENAVAPGDSDVAEAQRCAERWQKQRRWAEAEAAFRKVIRLAPANAAAHYGLGCAQWGQRRSVEAEAAFREAIRLAPAHPVPWCGLGSALRDQRRPVEAEAAFREAIRLAPEHASAHYGLGSALRDQRRAREAEAAFREAIRLAPEHPLAYHGLGHALSDQGRDAEALACHSEAAAREVARSVQISAASGP